MVGLYGGAEMVDGFAGTMRIRSLSNPLPPPAVGGDAEPTGILTLWFDLPGDGAVVVAGVH